MLQIVLLACILSLGVCEPDPEVEPAAAALPVYVHHDEHDLLNQRDRDGLYGSRKVGPILGKTQRLKASSCSCSRKSIHDHSNSYLHEALKAHVSQDTLEKQYKIIEHVYSPDYYEPTLVLDYRYLKSGGRDYTRGPGGQIIILPHGVRSHENKDHKDYDSLIEFLRLRNLAQTQALQQRHEDEARGHEHYSELPTHAHRLDREHAHRRGPEVRAWV